MLKFGRRGHFFEILNIFGYSLSAGDPTNFPTFPPFPLLSCFPLPNFKSFQGVRGLPLPCLTRDEILLGGQGFPQTTR